jgi:phosphohistidine phosphatase
MHAKSKCLYLVQHGESVDESVDPQRPLSPNGRTSVERVAEGAARWGLEVDRILHSGKLRAEQTAAIFADRLHPREGVVVQTGLAPNDDVQPVAEAVPTWSGSVMVVGHLPFLSRLASCLLIDDPQQALIQFRNGGIVGLAREAEHWTITCAIPPDWPVGPSSG